MIQISFFHTVISCVINRILRNITTKIKITTFVINLGFVNVESRKTSCQDFQPFSEYVTQSIPVVSDFKIKPYWICLFERYHFLIYTDINIIIHSDNNFILDKYSNLKGKHAVKLTGTVSLQLYLGRCNECVNTRMRSFHCTDLPYLSPTWILSHQKKAERRQPVK